MTGRHVLSLALALFAVPAAAAERKNVVVLIADDLGRDLGCYGNARVQTPHIDALAKRGTLFTHAFASVASCSPSRATLYTGLPTHQSGQYGLAHAEHNAHTFTKVQSLPKLLNAAGYATGIVGKNHVQPKEVYPWAFEANPKGSPRNVKGMADAAGAFIEEAAGKPFLLVMGYTDPHRSAKDFGNEKPYPGVPERRYDPKDVAVPFFLPDRPEVREDLARYSQSVSRLDHGVGLLTKVLEDAKVADNTLVIFLSDNGVPFPGAKTTLYDPGVRLPFVVASPAQAKRGVTSAAMVSWLDLTPTVLDWCGVKPPAGLTGRSVLPLLDGAGQDGDRPVFGSHQQHEVTMYYPMRSVRTRQYKLVLNLAAPLEFPCAGDLYGSPTWQGVLKSGSDEMGKRSVKGYLHRPAVELFDLAKDPEELTNVADRPEYASVAAELKGKLKAWREQTRDPWLVKEVHE